jgi:hypothetical protein
MSLHLSTQRAAERATQLAFAFMHRQDTKGWDWSLGDAMPDPIDPNKDGRKIATQWIVVVNYAKDRTTLEGGSVVKVNIKNGMVVWSDESP